MSFSINEKTGKVNLKIPAKIGEAVDMLYQMRGARQRYAALEASVKAAETLVKDALLKKFGKESMDGAAGAQASMSVNPRPIPQLKDDKKFFAFVHKHKRFDLLQRRLNDGAIKEMWENNKAVPGIDKFVALVISVTKKTKAKVKGLDAKPAGKRKF